MVGSRCVVQGCDNHSNRVAGVALHSPTEKNKRCVALFREDQKEEFQPKARDQIRDMFCSFSGVLFYTALPPKPTSTSLAWVVAEYMEKKRAQNIP